MKKFVIILFIALFCFGLGIEFAEVQFYAKSAYVVNLDYNSDIVTISDSMGNLWEFIGCEDWQIGDHCACLMNKQLTKIVFDDKIISVRYEKSS